MVDKSELNTLSVPYVVDTGKLGSLPLRVTTNPHSQGPQVRAGLLLLRCRLYTTAWHLEFLWGCGDMAPLEPQVSQASLATYPAPRPGHP